MILYGYPLPPCRRTHSAAEQVVRRALFAPSPCSRGVASETRGCGGLVPRKAFSFGNFGQRQAQHRRARRKTAERQAQHRRARRKTAKGRRSTARLGGRRPKGRRSNARLGGRRPKGRRSTAGLGGRRPKAGAAPPGWAEDGRKAGEAPPGFRNFGQSQEKHRWASVTCAKAGGGRPERFVKAGFCLYESFWIPLAALPKNTLCRKGRW